MSAPVLSADAVTVRRGGRTLLDSVSLSLEPGTFTALLGPNGAGKSTLLRTLAGELRADGGQVELRQKPLSHWSARELACARAVVSQHTTLAFPWRVRELVALGRLPLQPSGARSPSEEDAAAVARALEHVGLSELSERSTGTLSGGELQRVHIARALAQLDHGEPGLLLLDEPTASLDPAQQHSLLSWLRECGHTILCILHDLALASAYADQVVVLKSGRCLAAGTPTQALSDEVLATAYGVRAARHPLTGTNGRHALFVLGPAGAPALSPPPHEESP